jgi:hypothetical protein
MLDVGRSMFGVHLFSTLPRFNVCGHIAIEFRRFQQRYLTPFDTLPRYTGQNFMYPGCPRTPPFVYTIKNAKISNENGAIASNFRLVYTFTYIYRKNVWVGTTVVTARMAD